MASFVKSPERYTLHTASLELDNAAKWRPSRGSDDHEPSVGNVATPEESKLASGQADTRQASDDPTGDVEAVREESSVPERHGSAFFESLFDEEPFGLIRAHDANAFAVYSKQTQRWDSYRFPNYLNVKPLIDGHSARFAELFGSRTSTRIIGFELSGGPVEELVAIDIEGRFQTLELEEAIDKELRPVLMGHGVLYYIAGGHEYAFSGITGTWDALKTPQLPEVRWEEGGGIIPDIQKDGFDTESIDGIKVTFPDYIATFTAAKGVWQMTPNEPADE